MKFSGLTDVEAAQIIKRGQWKPISEGTGHKKYNL